MGAGASTTTPRAARPRQHSAGPAPKLAVKRISVGQSPRGLNRSSSMSRVVTDTHRDQSEPPHTLPVHQPHFVGLGGKKQQRLELAITPPPPDCPRGFGSGSATPAGTGSAHPFVAPKGVAVARQNSIIVSSMSEDALSIRSKGATPPPVALSKLHSPHNSVENPGAAEGALPSPAWASVGHGRGDRRSELASWVVAKMRENVKAAKLVKAYGRFVPTPLYAELGRGSLEEVDLGDLAVVKKSILVCDIRRFTAIAETLGAATTYRLLNGICERIFPVVRAHGGFVPSTVGDAIIGEFETADEAALAGSEILSTIAAYNEKRLSKGWEPLRLGVGLHRGELLVGVVGNEEQMCLSSLGKAITVATSVEVMTKFYHAAIVATDTFVEQLTPPVRVLFDLRKLDRLTTNSVHAPMLVYEMACRGTHTPNFLATYEMALAAWIAGDNDQAEDRLADCLAQEPGETAASLLLERVHKIGHEESRQDGDDQGAFFFFTGCTESVGESSRVALSQQFSLLRIALSALYHIHTSALEGDSAFSRDRDVSSVYAPLSKENLVALQAGCEEFTAGKALSAAIPLGSGSSSEPPVRLPVLCGRGPPPSSRCPPQVISPVPLGRRNKNLPGATTQENILDIIRTAAGGAARESVPLERCVGDGVQQVGDEDEHLTQREKQIASWVLSKFRSSNIRASNKAFSRFVPSRFLRHLGKDSVENLEVGDSLMLHLTAMFCEVKVVPKREADGSTLSYSSSLASSRLRGASNQASRRENVDTAYEVLEVASRCLCPSIAEQGGYVDKFVADMMLAVFDTSTAAVRAALQILAGVKALNEDGRGSVVSVSIAVNSGPCVLGTIGDAERLDGTVIGNTVNVASRILSLSKAYGVRLMTSSNTGVGLPADHPSYVLRQVDFVQLAGTNSPIWVLEVIPSTHVSARIVPPFHAALADYHAKRFEQARDKFSHCLLQFPLDIPSQVYCERVANILRCGVPEDWSPAFTMAYKL